MAKVFVAPQRTTSNESIRSIVSADGSRRGSSSTDDQRQKQRQQQQEQTTTINKYHSFSHTVQPTMMMTITTASNNRRRKKQQRQQMRKGTTITEIMNCNKNGKLLIIVFVIGLFFCLLDIAYIFNYVGNMQQEQEDDDNNNNTITGGQQQNQHQYHHKRSSIVSVTNTLLLGREIVQKTYYQVKENVVQKLIRQHQQQEKDKLIRTTPKHLPEELEQFINKNTNEEENEENENVDEEEEEEEEKDEEEEDKEEEDKKEEEIVDNNEKDLTVKKSRQEKSDNEYIENNNNEQEHDHDHNDQNSDNKVNPNNNNDNNNPDLHELHVEIDNDGNNNNEEDEIRVVINEETIIHGFPDTIDPNSKEPIIQLVKEALGNKAFHALDDETLKKLPTVGEVSSLYGSKPIVYGLETCQKFQNLPYPAEHYISTAGTFNTGTNLMAELLIANCHMIDRYKQYGTAGVRWQVLWGKHTPVFNETFRQLHHTYNDTNLTANNIFPAVTVRDPFKWMQSMCRHEYAAYWHRDPKHCPNLLKQYNNNTGKNNNTNIFDSNNIEPVTIKYKEFDTHHDSMVDFWNDWYNDYIKAPFPRLIVRFEDIIFHPKEVTKLVCECAGGKLNKPNKRSGYKDFIFITESAKKGNAHGKEKTSYIDALVKYGTIKGRYNGFYKEDIQYAKQVLDPKLMEYFGYKFPSEHDMLMIGVETTSVQQSVNNTTTTYNNNISPEQAVQQ